MQKSRENVLKSVLILTVIAGLYLIVAWASYSPLDNGWSVASSATQAVLNKSGAVGAKVIDFLLAMFGYAAIAGISTLTFSSAYLLLLKRVSSLNNKHIALWLTGLFCFILGLSGLFSVLLANTPYYLSGGFIGGLLNQVGGHHIGQVGVLLISMVLTSVGFYFCSGQILIGLFNRLYHWILADKHTAADEIPLQKSPGNTSPVQPNFMQTKVIQEVEPIQDVQKTWLPTLEGLIDVSDFVRTKPNISGLYRTEQYETEQVHAVNMPTDTISKAQEPVFPPAHSTLPLLSKICVPHSACETVVEQVSSYTESTNNGEDLPLPDEPVMPKIRLNPINPDIEQLEAMPQKSDEPSSKTWLEDNRAPSFKVERAALSDVVEKPLNMNIVQAEPQTVGQPKQEEVMPKTVKTPTYPKGYGDHLIHPLLQPKTTLEKPTTPLPTLDLLEQNQDEVLLVSDQEILDTSARIEKELSNFGVKASVEDVLVGPVVTRYEIKPAPGVKASKISSLDSDLARALIFNAIRITDFVPGKPHMGIETPNKYRQTVWLRDVLGSDAFQQSRATLPMALGKDISGQPVVVDMAKMPHLLVAGQTGGGKSVGVNTMILSLLYKLTPDEVRFIMIDPKVVELSIYNDIPHLLTPVVTDMKKAENALRWAVEEMERRYLLVSSLNVRNIEGYNDKIRQAEEMGYPIPNTLWRPGDTMDTLPPPLEKMSYIVLIVDEFADLMMSAGKQVEDHIMRIAQKARAVGIHLILATQRPSTDVITGVIKANIPSRIAFTVASQIDSRTILDKGGAESLLGRGDMLYSGAGSSEIIRVHGAFMTDDDVQRVADNWRARGKPEYIESIVASRDEEGERGSERGGSNELDPLFDEIAQFMIDGGSTSISGIQRRFSLGFNRAARIIDQLEEQGIISAADSRGRREVLAR